MLTLCKEFDNELNTRHCILDKGFAKLPSDLTNKSLPQLRHKPYSGSKDTLPAGFSTTISYGPLNNTRIVKTDMKILLTEQETKICNILTDVTELLKKDKPKMADLTLRIAGGWVRDKSVNKYLCENNYPVSSIGKIEKNSGRSKHLQTAATKVFGLEKMHCVGISRSFYNIHTRQVEDFTEKGLENLSLGLIRTPLPAYQTFLENPLRVLRCIRFASRFHFSIVDEILETVKNEDIRVALLSKISRERVGIEIDKMIKGVYTLDPLHSFELIQSFNLYEIIFIPPSQTTIISGIIHKPIMGVNVSRILKWLISSGESTLDPDISIRPLAEVRSLYLASILVPYLNVVVQDGKREVPAVSSVIRKSLKLPNSDIDNITKLFDAMGPLNSAAIKNEATPLDRVYLGNLYLIGIF
ncbi:hypothetical protein G9A89_003687 [Geosiphon pyriformis]|nr:hypothetical protein G9A89_003687 [Geosiphon pyriformis]